MLNKDCKIKSNKQPEAVDKTPALNKQKTTGSKKAPGAKSSGSKKSNKFFTIMVVVWLIPVFVSVYLLYLQFKQYSRNTESNIERTRNRNGNSPISREQLRRLREAFQGSERNEESSTTAAAKKANIYLVKVNRTVNRVYIKPVRVDLILDREQVGEAIRKLIEYRMPAALKKNDYYSCIPSNTKLINVNTADDTITINLSDRFMEGLSGTQQIKLKAAQIVYTATQFPGINKVKFVVNNKVLRDWGGEGVFPGAVLSRSDVPRIMALN